MKTVSQFCWDYPVLTFYLFYCKTINKCIQISILLTVSTCQKMHFLTFYLIKGVKTTHSPKYLNTSNFYSANECENFATWANMTKWNTLMIFGSQQPDTVETPLTTQSQQYVQHLIKQSSVAAVANEFPERGSDTTKNAEPRRKVESLTFLQSRLRKHWHHWRASETPRSHSVEPRDADLGQVMWAKPARHAVSTPTLIFTFSCPEVRHQHWPCRCLIRLLADHSWRRKWRRQSVCLAGSMVDQNFPPRPVWASTPASILGPQQVTKWTQQF